MLWAVTGRQCYRMGHRAAKKRIRPKQRPRPKGNAEPAPSAHETRSGALALNVFIRFIGSRPIALAFVGLLLVISLTVLVQLWIGVLIASAGAILIARARGRRLLLGLGAVLVGAGFVAAAHDWVSNGDRFLARMHIIAVKIGMRPRRPTEAERLEVELYPLERQLLRDQMTLMQEFSEQHTAENLPHYHGRALELSERGKKLSLRGSKTAAKDVEFAISHIKSFCKDYQTMWADDPAFIKAFGPLTDGKKPQD